MSSEQSITMLVPRHGLATGDAKILVEANGYEGQACQDATAAFLEALGTVGTNEELTEDFFKDSCPEERLHEEL